MKRLTSETILLVLVFLGMLGCGKDPVATKGTPTVPANDGVGSTVGSLATYKKIPLPLVAGNLIIPNLGSFYVTNKGPYVQIVDRTKMLWSVHKYQGSGSPLWSSFTPNFVTTNFIPSSFDAEKDREFNIFWSNTDLSADKYGMYNLNNGSPSFEYPVPKDAFGPGRFTNIIPAKKGFHRLWGISGNEIWVETAVAAPHTFKKIEEISSVGMTGFLRKFFSDPDEETVLWCANERKLFKIGSVGSTAGSSPGTLNSWDFSSISSTDMILDIIKVDNAIVIQFGRRVYKLEGNTFKSLGTLQIAGATSNIATSGSTIYASDGTYYNSNSNSWVSFIGSGKNLTGNEATRYNELKALCSGGLPIGVINGSATGPVYLLTPTDLIQITPIL